MSIDKKIETDCIVVGAGAAGCTAALELAKEGKQVLLIDKESGPERSSSYKLAGGFNSISPESKAYPCLDSTDKFMEETLDAGFGFNKKSFVKLCGERFYPDVIQYLEDMGVVFDPGLHKEGSKTVHRVHHVSDHTGRAVMDVLYRKVKEHTNIQIMPRHLAFDLITNNWVNNIVKEHDVCRGLYAYSIDDKIVRTIEADAIFIATGGLGMIFPATSNTSAVCGDGIAMAYRSHLPLAMMEMLQFHPTGLATEGYGEKPLCTQALRGSGAFLKATKSGKNDSILEITAQMNFGYKEPFDSNGTRAGVTRVVDWIMRNNNTEFVWLDCSLIPADKLVKEFSDFYNHCIKAGYDPTREPVPVRPILHYSNGGVLVGSFGETIYEGNKGMERIYFIGEDACTGLHGADRFPSNSGPEAVLLGRRAVDHYMNSGKASDKVTVPLWDTRGATTQKESSLMDYYISNIQHTMGHLCGIVRSAPMLEDGKAVLDVQRKRIRRFYYEHLVDEKSLTARNMLDVANVIMDSALLRSSSAGCHYRSDFPQQNPNHYAWSVVQKGRTPFFMPIPE